MEHLPRPNGQEKSIFPAIPYLCLEKYDGGPFLDYPRRSGLPNIKTSGNVRLTASLSSASRQFLATAVPAALEVFLQNWLFFGLLSEVLGDLYRHEDFVTTSLDGETEKTIVTTANLVTRLEDWEARITQDKDSLMAVYEHIAKCLQLTHACLVIQYATFDNDLKFHLASVAELLGYAASKACNVAWTDSPSRFLIPVSWGTTINEDFWKSALFERSNCCPSQMQMLRRDFASPQALAFVAGCFYEDVVQLNHASCDGDSCRAGDSVSLGQVTRHVRDFCQCEFLQVDEDELADCLKKGRLPLLRLKEDAEMMSIQVVPSTDSTFYVALSHVWADGLGNPKSTALPRCQLSRLKALIENLDFDYVKCEDMSNALDYPGDASEILLWCDTLCCPVVSKEAHDMALRQMYRTYDEASAVLVLDRSLISHRAGGMRVDEACVRIATSRWMTRLWTLQESALPARKNKLWFQFTKTALPVRTLYGHLVKIKKTDIRRQGVVDSVIGRFFSFKSLFDVQSTENQGAQMEDIMNGLLYRSVTVPSDEPLIIATLLALDLSRILASEPAERMNILWRIIGISPSGIDKHILFHMGPKIYERGLRWAPQSLLSVDRYFSIPKPGEEEHRFSGHLDRNAKGLVVELAGFRISIAKPAKSLPRHLAGFDSKPRNGKDRHCPFLTDCRGRWYVLKQRLFGEPDCPPALEEMCAVISGLSSHWILYRGSSSLVPDNTKPHLGVLVEEASGQQPQSNKGTCVEIRSQVAFYHLAAEMNQVVQAAYCLAQELASSTAARHLEDLSISPTELDNALYQEALQGVELEKQRLSRSPFALEALAASGDSADERAFTMIGEYMERIYRGIYVQIEKYVPGNRKWCVD